MNRRRLRTALLACALALGCASHRPPAPALDPAASIDGLDAGMRAAEREGHRYWLISRNDEYSQDPLIGVAALEAVRVGGGRTAVVFRLTNRRPAPLDLKTTKCVLLDGRGNEQPVLRTPSGTIASGASTLAAYVFDTAHAQAQPLSMRLVIPDVKTIWPIVFSDTPPPG